MISNIFETEKLQSLATRKKNDYEFQTISRRYFTESHLEGWEIHTENKNSLRLKKKKPKNVLLEDRVWSLLFKMGFSHISGQGGSFLSVNPTNDEGPKTQIDIFVMDNDVALAIECKSKNEPKKDPQFQNDISKLSNIRERFINTINTQYRLDHKRIAALAIFTWDYIIIDNDIERANQDKVVLFNYHDLTYYEQLVSHLGAAAKYQFFADLFKKRKIDGLKIKIPALKTTMGEYDCYNFSITPEYLLKIAYVSHRAKGKASDVNTYQRMIKKSRLKNIQKYISEDGIFPTNIVINLEGKGYIKFEPSSQMGSTEGAKYGFLHLTPSYGTAWIIDGQHRLFAYSGHKRAKTSYLNVIAFVNLPADKQAKLFIDINHEQKSVSRNLLHELFAELNWNAEDKDKQIAAIISKAIQILNENRESPFQGRILLSDDPRSSIRCITLESMFSALKQPGFFVIKKDIEYGPLWAGDSDQTLLKTVGVVKQWFNFIKHKTSNWWEIGSAEGGGLSMNDGVTICIDVLKSVFNHLSDRKHIKLIKLSNEELIDIIKPFGEALGEYFNSFSLEKRKEFRSSARGGQGQTAWRKKCEKALHEMFPDFEPPGLKETIELETFGTNQKAYPIIIYIEKKLHDIVISILKTEFKENDKAWWFEGVPTEIRKECTNRMEDDKGSKGGPESYFDLIDYRKIISKNWNLFQEILAFNKKGNKDDKTSWIVEINEMRKIVMHASKGQFLTLHDLEKLTVYENWLKTKLEYQE